MTMRINGAEISEAAIFAEMQYHRAATVAEAQRLASEALAVKELLAQEALARGFADGVEAIDALLAAVVPLTMPSDAACRSFYESQADRFRSNDLIEGEHILIAADPEDVAAASPDESAEVALRRAALRRAMETLDPRERELVSLKFFAGLTNAEIAAVIGTSATNAGTRLHRTMDKLRRACDEAA